MVIRMCVSVCIVQSLLCLASEMLSLALEGERHTFLLFEMKWTFIFVAAEKLLTQIIKLIVSDWYVIIACHLMHLICQLPKSST